MFGPIVDHFHDEFISETKTCPFRVERSRLSIYLNLASLKTNKSDQLMLETDTNTETDIETLSLDSDGYNNSSSSIPSPKSIMCPIECTAPYYDRNEQREDNSIMRWERDTLDLVNNFLLRKNSKTASSKAIGRLLGSVECTSCVCECKMTYFDHIKANYGSLLNFFQHYEQRIESFEIIRRNRRRNKQNVFLVRLKDYCEL